MTIEQLAAKVLSKLGVHQSGNPIEAADLLNVSDAYTGVYHTLSDDALVTWALTDTDIPGRFQLPLTTLIAAEIADFYHVPAPMEGWQRTRLLAINTIRRQLASGQDAEHVTAEYF